MMTTVFLVALGGAVGSVGRYLTGIAALRAFGTGFPAGTLIVNVAGSFAIGVLFVLLARGDARLSPFLLTGVLGGFTTFSAFSLDAFRLFERGDPGLAGLYLAASVGLSIIALAAGAYAMRAVAA